MHTFWKNSKGNIKDSRSVYCLALFCGSNLSGQVLLEWVLEGTGKNTESEVTGKFPFKTEVKVFKTLERGLVTTCSKTLMWASRWWCTGSYWQCFRLCGFEKFQSKRSGEVIQMNVVLDWRNWEDAWEGKTDMLDQEGAAHQGTANFSWAPSRFCIGVTCLLTESHTATALRNVKYIQYLTKGQDPRWQFQIAPPLFVWRWCICSSQSGKRYIN